jgi:hypothetical protein
LQLSKKIIVDETSKDRSITVSIPAIRSDVAHFFHWWMCYAVNGRFTMKHVSFAILLACACASNDEPAISDPIAIKEEADRARQLFDEVFQSGQYERIPEVRAALEAVFEKDPTVNDGDVTMLLGVSYLWSTAEWERFPARGKEARFEEVLQGDYYLTHASQLRPSDGRVQAWLGIMKAFRSQTELDLALYQESLDRIGNSVELFPEFGHLVVAFVKSAWPAQTTEFAGAVDHIWQNVDVCIQGKIDRTMPNFEQYMHLSADTTGNRRACWSTPLVPHNLEGFWFHMGDLLVKNNQADVAKIAYGNAALIPSYANWKYRAELETRMANVHANAALYLDDEPKNDPPILPQTTFQCVLCHAR